MSSWPFLIVTRALQLRPRKKRAQIASAIPPTVSASPKFSNTGLRGITRAASGPHGTHNRIAADTAQPN